MNRDQDHAGLGQLLRNESEHISFLQVNTDVMQEAGIEEGDVIAVDRRSDATNNNIIVTMIGSDMVIRKLEAAGGREILVTPGRRLSPLDVTGRLKVWGVVVYVIKKIRC